MLFFMVRFQALSLAWVGLMAGTQARLFTRDFRSDLAPPVHAWEGTNGIPAARRPQTAP